jgi:alpha-D-xyloside xylohydrolase
MPYIGKVFLAEKAGTCKLIPGTVSGEPCYKAEQSFESSDGEYIYGLGQFQDGHFNLKGITRRLPGEYSGGTTHN